MNYKEICKKLLFPPVWLMIILAVLSTAGLVTVFVKGWDTSPIAYVVYMLAFYTLMVICIAGYFTFPGYYKNIRKKIYNTKFGNRYMTDVVFKTHVSLYRSLAINLLYVALNLFSGFWYRSAWFVILAVYYIILAVMRFLLLRYVNKNEIGQNYIGELRRSRLCAIILLTVNLALTGAVLMILYQNRGYEYHGILIYVMAMYTFYVTTSAVINIIKYRKYKSPVLSTAKVINLAAALVSMLALETAMLSQFGAENSPEFRRIMVASTGGGISVIVVTLSIYMIVRANKAMKEYKISNS